MAEKLLLIQLVLFNSDSVLCVLQLIILYFCLKKYIQSTYGTVLVRYVRTDCFRFTHDWDYKNTCTGTVRKIKRLRDYFTKTSNRKNS